MATAAVRLDLARRRVDAPSLPVIHRDPSRPGTSPDEYSQVIKSEHALLYSPALCSVRSSLSTRF